MNLVSVPLAAFIFMLGICWSPQPAKPPNLEDAEDPAQAERDYQAALRRQARNGIARLIIILVGGLLLLLNLIGGLGTINTWENFALLVGVYGGLFLLVQRSEVNRRLATLVILTPLTLIIVPRYAAYEGFKSESNWAVFAALLLNYLFWLIIGRRYPVGSSQDIKVWGMDD